MTDTRGTPRGLTALGAVLLLAPFWALRRLELPLWATVLWLGTVGAGLLFCRWAPRAARHERFCLQDEWASGLPAAQALDRITEHFRAEGATVRQKGKAAVVDVGSDVAFRLGGTGSARGRRRFPAALTVTATDTGAGSALRAQCRDNLGWYATMPARIPQWAAERNARLVDSARCLTGAATERARPAGAEDRPCDGGLRPGTAAHLGHDPRAGHGEGPRPPGVPGDRGPCTAWAPWGSNPRPMD